MQQSLFHFSSEGPWKAYVVNAQTEADRGDAPLIQILIVDLSVFLFQIQKIQVRMKRGLYMVLLVRILNLILILMEQ